MGTQKLVWVPLLYKGKRSEKQWKWLLVSYASLIPQILITPFRNTYVMHWRMKKLVTSRGVFAKLHHLPSITVNDYPLISSQISSSSLMKKRLWRAIIGGWDELRSVYRPKPKKLTKGMGPTQGMVIDKKTQVEGNHPDLQPWRSRLATSLGTHNRGDS